MPEQRVDPLVNELKAMKRRMDALFMKSVGDAGEEESIPKSAWQPQVDALETEEAWLFVVDLPGVPENELQLEVVDHAIRISGNKPLDQGILINPDQAPKAIKRERSHGPFNRILAISRDAKEEAIQAELKHGVLTILIPKKHASSAAQHKITVQSF